MPATDHANAAHRAFRASLDEDARQRELSIASFTALLTLGCGLFAIALWPQIGIGMSARLCAALFGLSAYYGVLWLALRRGHFHPAVAWVNVAVEVSAPAGIILIDAVSKGGLYAATSPPLVIWGAMVMLSSLRTRWALAWAAGGLAAVEYLLLYAVAIRPGLPADVLVTLSPSFFVVRAALLFAYGPLTSIVGRYVMRKAEAALQEVRANDLFGKYLLHERIGSGGMAEVFRATYSPVGGFEKVVAVKRVLPAYAEDPDFVALFKEEAELGSRLNHQNIVQVLDLVRHGETLFLAMEFVDGFSLKTVLKAFRRRGLPVPVRAVTFVAAEVAAALDYLHTKTDPEGGPLQLIHRDLNPPNILVSRFGDVKVADFGIARAQGRAVVTQANQIRGKAAYMAPEQAMGMAIDGRIDLFALGLTMNEALTGERPLRGDSETALMRASIDQPIPAASSVRPEVPAELDTLIARMLVKDREARIGSAARVREALLALPEMAAPYPHGRAELAAAVRLADEHADEQMKSGGSTSLLSEHVTQDGADARPTERTRRGSG